MLARLEEEWRVIAAGPSARQAAARWAERSEIFSDLATPAAVVVRCHERSDPALSRAVLSSLLLVADNDDWARRTVLQALLPGLAHVAERACGLGQGRVRPWTSLADLDQHVVTLACERIAQLSGRHEPWVARVVADGVWQRLRTHARGERRRAARQTTLDDVDPCEEESPCPGEELASHLADAVRRGVIDADVACVVYSFRVAGRSPDEMAPTLQRSPRTLWRWLERGERALVGDAGGVGVDQLAVGTGGS